MAHTIRLYMHCEIIVSYRSQDDNIRFKVILREQAMAAYGLKFSTTQNALQATRVSIRVFFYLPSALKFKALFSSPSDTASPILEHPYTEKPVQLLESQQIPQISLWFLAELQDIL